MEAAPETHTTLQEEVSPEKTKSFRFSSGKLTEMTQGVGVTALLN